MSTHDAGKYFKQMMKPIMSKQNGGAYTMEELENMAYVDAMGLKHIGTYGTSVVTTTGSGSYVNVGTSKAGPYVYGNRHEIIGVKWYGTIGFVAVLSGAPGSGEWKVYCGQVPNFGTPEDDAHYIASNGNKIPDWQVATALFPDLDPQLFIW